MKKKILVAGCTLVMIAGLFAGCGKSQEEQIESMSDSELESAIGSLDDSIDESVDVDNVNVDNYDEEYEDGKINKCFANAITIGDVNIANKNLEEIVDEFDEYLGSFANLDSSSDENVLDSYYSYTDEYGNLIHIWVCNKNLNHVSGQEDYMTYEFENSRHIFSVLDDYLPSASSEIRELLEYHSDESEETYNYNDIVKMAGVDGFVKCIELRSIYYEEGADVALEWIVEDSTDIVRGRFDAYTGQLRSLY